MALRGNRYPVLEEEFFAFVLAPHDHALRQAYGVGSQEIAAGFQAIADSIRTGHAQATDQIEQQMEAAQVFAAERNLTPEHSTDLWTKEHPECLAAALESYNDLLRGGICNLSKHSGLPSAFLEDLSWHRGEEQDFFAPGPYCGTPLRTLPARKKPLVKIGEDYFAIDPCFARDSGYRALLWNLLQRKPGYRKEFEISQKQMSEAAFSRVLADQLVGAKVHQEVWYKDSETGHWVENDTLIRLDDVLILVEAKAGAAATIASPALDFARHVRSVQELVIKAYIQCRRFFDYLGSAPEVALYRREHGRYVEFDRVRLGDYRVVIPVGLTVESFSPFSSMCKALPTIEPILGKYPFVSLSIDDLFVLQRFLPTAGELSHYLEVRQSAAGIKEAQLFDELDHLGAYISKNRFDETLKEQLSQRATRVVVDGMSEIIDRHFEGEGWQTRQPPKQEYPEEVANLLAALDSTRAPGWLGAESHIRSYGHEGRRNLATMLKQLRESLTVHTSRYFLLLADPPLFLWLQRVDTTPNLELLQAKASAAAIAAGSSRVVAIVAFATSSTGYSRAEQILVKVPTQRNSHNNAVFVDAERMSSRQVSIPDTIKR